MKWYEPGRRPKPAAGLLPALQAVAGVRSATREDGHVGLLAGNGNAALPALITAATTGGGGWLM